MTIDRRLYVVVRADLPPAMWIPQACHAVAEVGRLGLIRADEEPPIMVVLAAADLTQLSRTAVRCRDWGIRFAPWCEPDHGLGLTAIATEPICGKMRGALRGLSPLEFVPQHDAAA